jgi:hypothetical protein
MIRAFERKVRMFNKTCGVRMACQGGEGRGVQTPPTSPYSKLYTLFSVSGVPKGEFLETYGSSCSPLLKSTRKSWDMWLSPLPAFSLLPKSSSELWNERYLRVLAV